MIFSLFSVIVAYGLGLSHIKHIVNVSTIFTLPSIYSLYQTALPDDTASVVIRYVLCQSFHGDDRKHVDTITCDIKKKSIQQISPDHPSSLHARGTGEDTHKDIRFLRICCRS